MGDTNWHPGLILVTKSLGRNKGETRHGSADSINPEETTTSSPRHQLKFNTLQDHWKRLMIHPPKNIVEHVL